MGSFHQPREYQWKAFSCRCLILSVKLRMLFLRKVGVSDISGRYSEEMELLPGRSYISIRGSVEVARWPPGWSIGKMLKI